MQYLGDKSPGATFTSWFTTADSDGVPAALTSGAISVYKDNSDTQSTSGVTLSASADSVTGANRVVVDTSADGSFYSAGSDFTLMLTAGTVDGNSVVGYVVGRFTLRESAAYDAVAAGVGLADGAITDAKIASGALTAAKFASGAFDAVWSVATRVLTAGTNIVLAKGTGVTGFNDLDAGGVRTAVGLASANLDTQLGTIDDNVDAIKAVTDNLPDSGALTSIAQQSDLEALDAKADDILEDTGTTLPGTLSSISSAIGGLNDLSAAEVNAEVVDALSVDTYAEPGQGAPPATASIAAKVGYLFKAFRNKHTQTADTYSLYNDAGDTVDQKATVSDTGTEFTRDKVTTGA